MTDAFTGTPQLNFTVLNAMGNGLSQLQVLQKWVLLFTVLEGSVGLDKLSATVRSQLDASIRADDPSSTLSFDVMASSLFATAIVKGTAGSDVLQLNNPQLNTIINGGDGDDVIYGGYGYDTLIGGRGNDTLYSNWRDSAFAGDGNDTINVTGDSKGRVYDGGLGVDALNVSDANISESIVRGIEQLRISGQITLTGAQFAAISFIYATGTPYINFATSGTYNLSTKTIIGNVYLRGSNSNDVLSGNALGKL